MLQPEPISVNWITGGMAGAAVEESVKTLGQLNGLFHDEAAWKRMDPTTEVYRVRYWRTVPEGTEGGLYWGCTILQPGQVGDEYFMTHGHHHAVRDRAELYGTVEGEGALVLMAEDRSISSQAMQAGTLHYIPGRVAHRVVNTGKEPLVFVASWPSDAGHDYESIRAKGFGRRMVERAGAPCLI